jgi:hypothetical protein
MRKTQTFARNAVSDSNSTEDMLMIRTVTDSVSKESAIDEVIATCNGDMRGAIKALLLVNEHLEAELQHYARRSNLARRSNVA